MRARHLVTVGIGLGAFTGLAVAFGGCGESTFGTCQDTASCEPDASSTGDGTTTDQHAGNEGSAGEGGIGDGGVHEGGEGGNTVSCDAATAIACNGVCVDKETDPGNCGTCGHSCAGPEAGTGQGVCASGACGVSCEVEAGTTLLCPSGACVDPTTIATCGSCANTCYGPEAGPGHAVCQPGGMCAIACDSDAGEGGMPDILCSGACVSPDNITHCGNCTPCAQPPSGNGAPTCPAAQCVMTCNAGYHPSGASCNADCTLTAGDDPSTDPCVVADAFGIFVAEGSPVASANGTKEHPYATIVAAMDAAVGANKRVYACGTFTVPSAVGATEDGVTVYGGFDCATWTYNASNRTKVAPTAAGFALTITGLTTGVTFEDFEFDAQPAPPSAATAAGASSMTVIANGSAGVVFRRVTINARAAQLGGVGANGTNTFLGSAATGNPSSSGAGGGSLSCACGGTAGQGGGAGVLNVTTSQFTPGEPGQDGTPLGVANHGNGSTSATTPCSAGDPNGVSTGAPGPGGTGGAGRGTLTYPAGWTNAAVGGPGGSGVEGQGGGGAGGHYYVSTDSPSGGGGGGGCGGCGGAPGSGAYAGGSSISLVMIASSVTLDTCTLTAAAGGVGGAGGSGQSGQTPGGGGSGDGAGSCSGGVGGSGGQGGAGGGGVGGNSIAVAYSGAAPTHVGTVTETVATATSGGSPGGGNSTATSQGQPGVSVQEQSF